MEILEQLFTIQQELKAPKDQYNKFGKFHYRSCESILEALKPILKELKCVIVLSDEVVTVGDANYIKATATLKNMDGGSTSNTAYAREIKDKSGSDHSQLTGTASSYARKYALNGLMAIEDAKDADTDEFQTEKENRQKMLKATKEQVDFLKTKYKGKDLECLLKTQNISKLEDLSIGKANDLIEKLGGMNNA